MSKFVTLNERGLLIEVDLHTGEERQLEHSLAEPSTLPKEQYRQVMADNGDLVWVENHITIDDLEKVQGRRKHFPYSQLLAQRIAHEVANGKTLKQICESPGMPPYSVLTNWRRHHVEFQAMLDLAREDRGEYFFTRMLEEAETASADRDAVSLARLRTDIYKYAAKVSNPKEFSETTKVDASVKVGAFSLETGIRREGDPGFNVDETLKLIDEGEKGG